MDSDNVQSFQAKYQSKRECYNFLTVQVEIYLPAYETVTIYFLKDIISGKKKRKCRIHFFSNRAVDVKAKNVRTICIPQYEGLAMKDMDEQVFQLHPIIFDYLPDQVEIHKTPKQWICNVSASVLGDVFVNWVKDQIEARNAKVTKQKDLLIAMDPDVAAAFQQSTAVSCKCLITTIHR